MNDWRMWFVVGHPRSCHSRFVGFLGKEVLMIIDCHTCDMRRTHACDDCVSPIRLVADEGGSAASGS